MYTCDIFKILMSIFLLTIVLHASGLLLYEGTVLPYSFGYSSVIVVVSASTMTPHFSHISYIMLSIFVRYLSVNKLVLLKKTFTSAPSSKL